MKAFQKRDLSHGADPNIMVSEIDHRQRAYAPVVGR
jgi:hypothetical protein